MKKIKFLCVLALLVWSSSIALAQHLSPVQQASAIQFKISHKMIFRSTVAGSFTGLKGSIVFDTKDVNQASFNVSVNAESINTGIGMRDSHLKEEDYFDTGKYPLITVRSQRISKAKADDGYIFTGTLTMKGVTKNISFPFTVKAAQGGYEFNGSFEINRLDYKVGPDNSIDKKVDIQLAVLAKQE